jgi:hypothetical protein
MLRWSYLIALILVCAGIGLVTRPNAPPNGKIA